MLMIFFKEGFIVTINMIYDMGNYVSMHKRKIIENNFNNNEAPIKLSEPKTK